MKIPEYDNPDQLYYGVEKKLSHQKVTRPMDCICLWSDLLGFGKPFFDNNWSLSTQEWLLIQKRLFAAQSVAILNYILHSSVLVLNDGIAITSVISNHKLDYLEQNVLKLYDSKGNLIDTVLPASALLQLSLFINSAVRIHLGICEKEKSAGYPGTRSVLAFGQCSPYITPEVTKNDYKLPLEEENEESKVNNLSKVNDIILFNPYSFQMNTAFSKAFIIESKGSKARVEGANLYIDESVITRIKDYAKDRGIRVIEEEHENYVEILVPRNPDNITDVILGFRLSKPFSPRDLKFNTQIYRILRFYPHDELTSEFWFDLSDSCGYDLKE